MVLTYALRITTTDPVWEEGALAVLWEAFDPSKTKNIEQLYLEHFAPTLAEAAVGEAYDDESEAFIDAEAAAFYLTLTHAVHRDEWYSEAGLSRRTVDLAGVWRAYPLGSVTVEVEHVGLVEAKS